MDSTTKTKPPVAGLSHKPHDPIQEYRDALKWSVRGFKLIIAAVMTAVGIYCYDLFLQFFS